MNLSVRSCDQCGRSFKKSGSSNVHCSDLCRFWSKTTRVGKCVEWTAATDKDGYGKFQTGKHKCQSHHRAHKWIYEQLVGRVGDNYVLHECDNPRCVHVKHLFLGDAADNHADSKSKNRHSYGSKNGMSKLTETQVKQIRRKYDQGMTLDEIADQYPVTRVPIHQIVTRKTWKHV